MKAVLAVPLAVLAASLGFLFASCGADGDATSAGPVPSVGTTTDGTSEEIPTTTGVTDSGTEPVETIPTEQVTYQLWFHTDDGLYVTYGASPPTPRIGTAALEALLRGSPDVRLDTSIPRGTQLLGLTIDDGIARVDLTSEFESGGGSASMQMRLAQIVYTITQFPTVKGVVFSLDGEPIDVLGGEGVIIDHPLTRQDYIDFLPAILVTKPIAGQTVPSPIVVRGSANVFEANVSVEILDKNNEVIATTFTTATCGTGCRGIFKVSVPYEVDEVQPGTVVVHDDDAAGTGTYPHEVRIPVVLTPES
ncbi:MAG: GerMN domain-containing protein [Gaiellaceae bacterium]